MRAIAALALSAVLWPAAAAAAERTVASGPLRATVSRAPWHLRFADRRGPLLDELGETGPALPGTLAYAAGGTWFHATRVTSEHRVGRDYVFKVATTNPLGPFTVRLGPDAGGVIALSATAPTGAQRVAVTFATRARERFLGFGERSNAVDQRGNTVESYVADGPYLEPERPAIAGFVPAPGYRARDDATYFPIPWMLSTAGYGVLLDGYERSEFHLASDRPDAWTAAVDGRSLRLRVFDGPTPGAALRRFTARVGRQPAPAAPWYFGPWFQPRDSDAASIAKLRRADAPASVGQTYTHYLPCGDQRGAKAEQRRRTALYHRAGLAVTTYFNPMICTSYSPVYGEAARRGLLTRNAAGKPYTYRYTGSTVFQVAQFDFSSPAARTFYGGLLREAVHDGYDGWMEDFGEYTPTDARSADGTPGRQMHNRYPLLYHRAARDFARGAGRPLARFNRSGWTGAARQSQIVWGGDPSTTWGFDGLQSALRQGLTMGLSGVSLWGSDIGGFFTLSAPQLTPELLERWIELGAVSGVMRTQANGFALPQKPRRPQIFDPDVLPVWRRYAKLRTQLYPYLASAARAYELSGRPIMRHLALVFPRDARAAARDDEFMFGPDVLAAPVMEPGARTRTLYAPRGRWVDLWRSATLGRNGGPRLRRARVLTGGRNVTLPAPVRQLPLLVRAGGVLPLLPADVDTLTRYGRARGLVHLRDRVGRMRLLAFPRGRSEAGVGRREYVRSDELQRGWRLTVHGRHRRHYSLEASLAVLERPFRPCAMRVRGRRLRRGAWSYASRSRTLRTRFTLRSGRVTVSRCRRG